MSLASYTRFLKDKNLSVYSGAGAKISAQSLGFQLVNTGDPIDSLTITFSGVISAIGTGSPVWSPASLIELINRIKVKRTLANGTSHEQVNISGPGLYEYCLQVLGNVDNNTLSALSYGAAAFVHANGDAFSLKLHVPFAHPQLPDRLRLFMALNGHQDQQPVDLQIDLADSDTLNTGTAKALFTSLTLAVEMNYLKRTSAFDAAIASAGGYIKHSLVETSAKTFGADPFLDLPRPGYASGILLRSWSTPYVAGSALGVRGDSSSTAGTKMSLTIGGETYDEFTLPGLVARNRISSNAQLLRTAVSAVYNCDLGVGSAYLDFISNLAGPDTADNLGSLLPLASAVNNRIEGAFATTAAMSAVVHKFDEQVSSARVTPAVAAK